MTSSIGIAVYPGRFGRSRRAAEARRRRDVPLEGARPQHVPVPRRRPGRAPAAPAHAGNGAARRAARTARCKLHYQPVVRITDRAIVGAEALLRWNDPEHGSVPPQVFIPLAEESGLIHALGEWVLQTAAAQCATWRKAGLPLTVSVNLSARQFYREDLAQRISDIVRGAGCEPSWIELEVTETSLLHDLDAIRKVLHQLRDEGFTVAIDDFGTGYSSLTHLKHFPIDTLKIDISFIADLETDPRRRGDHRGDHRPRARPRPEGRRRRRGHAASSSTSSTRAAATASRAIWVSKPLPARRIRRVRRASVRSSRQRRVAPPQRRRASAPASVSSSVCEPAVAAPRAGVLPLALEHQHVREPRQDRRRRRRDARAVARDVVGRRDRDRRRRPARTADGRRVCGSAQCRRSDRSNSARGDSGVQVRAASARICGRDVGAEIERPQRLRARAPDRRAGSSRIMLHQVVGLLGGEPRRHRQQSRRRHRRQQRRARAPGASPASARRSRRPSNGRSAPAATASAPATCSTSAA